MQIVTHSGAIIPLLGTVQISINDIAWHLAGINRYTGAGRFYSVAQHSVVVSYLVPSNLSLQALLHDAHEAIVNDISTHVKQVLNHLFDNGWSLFEHGIASQVRHQYGVPEHCHSDVKVADDLAAQYEVGHIFDTKAHQAFYSLGLVPKYGQPEALNGNIQVPVAPMDASTARRLFLCRYRELAG